MKKYHLILAILFAIFAFSSLFFLSRGRVKSLNENKAENAAPAVDMAELRRQYGDNMGRVMAAFEESAAKIEKATASPDFLSGDVATSTMNDFASALPSVDSLESLRSSIENLRAPSSEYKDLHINLMLSVVAMESYVKSLFADDRFQALEMIRKARDSYEKLKSL